MVAYPYCSCTPAYGNTNRFRRRFRICPVHLYIILAMERQKHLETIIVLMLALLVFYWWKHENDLQKAQIAFWTALLLGLIAIFIPIIAKLLHDGWMRLAHIIGWITNKILLSIIFYVILSPLAALSRFLRRSPFRNKDPKTYYKERNFTYTAESLKDTW